MKKQFFLLAVATLLLTFSSCKKWHNCTCLNGSSVDWSGQVEAISKAKAVSLVQADCGPGDVASCD